MAGAGPGSDRSTGSVLGVIPVSARLQMGSEKLRLYVVNSGLIVARVGKRGAGTMLGSSIFGMLSAAIEDFVKGGRESLRKRESDESSPKAILRANKDNFFLGTDDIVKVELDASLGNVRMDLVTKNEKFHFSTNMESEAVESLLRLTLHDKVVMARNMH